MKRTILSLALALLSLAGFAQTDVNFALASAGSSATASTGNAGAAIDGQTNSRWESASADPQWWLLDMGQDRTFNSIRIIWEGAYGKTFTVSASQDGETYQVLLEVTGQKLSGFPHTQTFAVAETTARYVRFDGIERGTGYGYSFYEFEVFQAAPAELQSLSLTAPSFLCSMGDSVLLAAAGIDQYGRSLEVSPAYTITPSDAGTIVDNVFTPAHIGLVTIVAEADGLQSEPLNIVVYGGGNLALNKLLAESGHQGNDDATKAVDGNPSTLWNAHDGIGDAALREVDAWFTLDLGGFYDIDLISVSFEGARSEAYHIDASVDNASWRTIYTGGHTGVAAVVDYFYDNAAESKEVRYLRFFSTKDASGYGMKVYEMEVYGSPTPDEEAPVLLAANLIEANYNALTFQLVFEDNLSVTRCEAVDMPNMKRATLAVQPDSTITIEGLVPDHEYNFSLTAIDGAGNRSTEEVVATGRTTLRYTQPMAPAPVPEVPAEQVIAVYSDAYTVNPVWDNYHADWGDHTAFEEKTLEGDHYLAYSTLDWLGWTCQGAVNASVMEFIHIDIWSEKNGSLAFTPIYGGTGLDTDDKHSVTLSLKAQRWNSFDLPLSDFGTIDWSSIFQMKFSNNIGLAALAVDNVYFYRTTLYEDTIAPHDVALRVVESSYHSITLEVTGQDNGPSLSYTILMDGTPVVALSGAPAIAKQLTIEDLQMGTEHTFSAFAKDFSGLLSDTVSVVASTLAAPAPGSAPEPMQTAPYVRSLYSDHFAPFTSFYAGNWYQKTQSQEIVLAEGDTALLLTEFDYLGWEINNNVPMDMSSMSYLHIDVWTPADAVLTLLPISQGLADNAPGQALTLVGNEWNTFDLLLDEFPTDFKKFIQMKFSDATATTFVIDNVYFWGYVTALEQPADTLTPVKVIENGQVVILREGVKYDVTGRAIER